MNLIGHFACAAVPSAAVRAGAVLPDLAALYRRQVRPRALVQAWRERAAGPAGLEALLAGVAFHHEVDRHFHRAPLFRDGADAIQAALLGASRAPGLKRFLPAHVLCELYLDHLLLRRDPGLAAAFYRDLAAQRALLATFVAIHPLAVRERFAAFLERLVADRFVEAYRTHGGIFQRMNRMLLRFGQRPLEAAEQTAVTDYFTQAQAATEQTLESFLQAMRRLAPQAVPGAAAAAGRAAAARQWADGRLPAHLA